MGNMEMPLDDFLLATVDRAKEYLEKDLQVCHDQDVCNITRSSKPVLKDFTTLINVNGGFRGTFAMSIDEKLAICLVQKFIFDDIPSDQLDDYVEDTMGEIFNIILGNTIGKLSEIHGHITLESPTTIPTRRDNVRFVGLRMMSGLIHTEQGSLSINVVV